MGYCIVITSSKKRNLKRINLNIQVVVSEVWIMFVSALHASYFFTWNDAVRKSKNVHPRPFRDMLAPRTA
jgi:hypothetical protein